MCAKMMTYISQNALGPKKEEQSERTRFAFILRNFGNKSAANR